MAQVGEGLPPVWADPARLECVLTNLTYAPQELSSPERRLGLDKDVTYFG